jgi:hypothetical protein
MAWPVPCARAMRPGARAVTDDQARDRMALLHELRELVEALDRRVPHAERAGEITIARDSAQLRSRAIQRIAALEQDLSQLD